MEACGRALAPWIFVLSLVLPALGSPASAEIAVRGLVGVSLAAGTPRRLAVREEGRRPLAGVLVLLRRWRWPVGLTDDDGVLAWRGPAGEADVFLATEDGRYQNLRRSAPKPHGPPNSADLPAAGRLAGRVVDGLSRRPLPGAVVWWSGDEGHWATSDARGGYSLPANSQGMGMRMLAAAPGYQRIEVRVAAGAPAPTLALLPAAALAGVVVDEGGRAVAGAELKLQPEDGPRSTQLLLLTGIQRSAVSSAAGRFRFSGLAPDLTYRLTAKKAGYAPAELELSDLEPYAARAGLRLVLKRGRRAWGRVVDGDGVPIPGAAVGLEPASLEGGDRFPLLFRGAQKPLFEDIADETGRFELAGLQPGRFDLTARAPGFAPGVVPGIEIPEGEGPVEVGTVQLAPGVAVEGLVVDRRGQPLAGVEVRAQDSDPRSMMWAPLVAGFAPAQAVTAADGWFSLADLRRGEKIDLLFSGPGHASTHVPGVEVPPEAPLEVVLGPLSSISGRLLDPDGDPVAGGLVSGLVTRRGGSAGGATVHAILPGGAAFSDEDGRFRLEEIEPGTVELRARAQGRQPATLGELEVAPGQDLEGLEIVLEAGAVVAGTVLGPDGQPAVGVRVKAESEPEGGNRRPVAVSYTDGDGLYRLDGIAPGPRRFMAGDEDHPRNVADLEVAPGENHLDFQLEGGWEVSGWVVDEGGTPLAGTWMDLLGTGGRGDHRTVSGPDGAFAVAGLVDGTYRLLAGREGYFQVDSRQEVTVAGGPVAGVEVQLGAGGAITGRLRGLSFDELARVKISANGPGWGSGAATYEGSYRVGGLGPGSWRVSAEVPGSGRRAEGTVTLEPGAEEASLDLDFAAGLTLSGRVTSGGEPVGAAEVQVRGLNRHSSRVSVATDHAGEFVVENLEPGRYRLAVVGVSGILDEREVDLDGDRQVEIRLRLGDVRGRVVDGADSSPVAGAVVRLVGQKASASAWLGSEVRSDSAGRFALHGVPAGVHRVVAQKSGYVRGTAQVEVEAGEVAEGVELRLTATAGLTLTVVATAGTPVEEVRVALLDGAGRVVTAGGYLASEEGHLRISTVPPGAWTALVLSGDLAVVEVPVVVPGPPVAVSLPPGGRVTVTVPSLAATSTWAALTLLRPDGRPFRVPYWANQSRREWPLSGGKATVGGLEPGTWALTVTAVDGRTWSGTAAVTPGGTAEVSLE